MLFTMYHFTPNKVHAGSNVFTAFLGRYRKNREDFVQLVNCSKQKTEMMVKHKL